MAELRRVLIEPQRLAGCGQGLELTSDERHYLGFCGYGVAAPFSSSMARAASGRAAQQRLGSAGGMHGAAARHEPELVLLMGVIRRDSKLLCAWPASWASINQATASQRSVVGQEPTPQRWQSQLQEACEQCERLWLPQLSRSPAPATA